MTDHLPECPAPSEYGGGEYHIYDERPCICKQLRACEQRVNDPAWIEGLLRRRGEERFAAGVQAARDEVENLPDAIFQQAAWVKHEQALAAIDALKGMSE